MKAGKQKVNAKKWIIDATVQKIFKAENLDRPINNLIRLQIDKT